jgi:hypothetical protein
VVCKWVLCYRKQQIVQPHNVIEIKFPVFETSCCIWYKPKQRALGNILLLNTWKMITCINCMFRLKFRCLSEQIWRSQWPRGLRRRSTAARLLRLWVWIPPGAWTFVCCECCVLSVRGLWDELITRPEESYRLWCVVVCDLETSWMRRPWPWRTGGCCAKQKQRIEQSGQIYVYLGWRWQ